MKKNKYSYFKIALPMYLFGVFISLIIFILNQNYYCFLFSTIGFIFHFILLGYKSPFQKKLQILSDRMNMCINESDPKKEAIMLSIVAMRNANTCAAESNIDKENKHHWMFLCLFYDKLSKIHRESFYELNSKKQCEQY
jgi:hypothetical protein